MIRPVGLSPIARPDCDDRLMRQAERVRPEGVQVEAAWLPLRDVVARLNALGVGGWSQQSVRRLIDKGYVHAIRRPRVGPQMPQRLVDSVSLARLERVLLMPQGPGQDHALEALRAENETRRAGG